MNEDPAQQPEYVASITSDVLRVLTADGFFEALDDALCPVDDSKPAVPCRHNYENSERLLKELGFETEDLEDIFDVLRSRGGFCDCEILYNAVEASRLKAKYWRAEADRHRVERRWE